MGKHSRDDDGTEYEESVERLETGSTDARTGEGTQRIEESRTYEQRDDSER